MDDSAFKLSLELRIDWSDLDTYKHVNNLTFLKFMQSGRVNFWEATGLSRIYEETHRGPMLVSSHCDFRKSLYYPGKAIVKTKLAYLKNSSFGIDHIIQNEAGEVCAEGRDIAVCYDFNSGNTYRIPDDLREVMSRF